MTITEKIAWLAANWKSDPDPTRSEDGKTLLDLLSEYGAMP